MHHPYDDFSTSVLRLLEDAARDPDVVAVKLTLYRTGEDSPVVRALIRAAEAGKEVVVFVELKASYDEARNIVWVKALERAGAQVVYGVVGLKNHAKVALVVRREQGEIRRYAHVGTGNYNAGTARVYTDLGLLTADPAIGDDLGDLFNQLTGTSGPPGAALRRLLVAPEHLLPGLLARIARETDLARRGRPGRIRAKLNGVDDPEVVNALYAASQAGVEIDLVVRGLCTLRPGVAGPVRADPGARPDRPVSSSTRVSITSRTTATEEYFIGSADWRSRNLRRRVEVAVPILDAACRRQLDRILTRELADPSAWELAEDGRYRQVRSVVGRRSRHRAGTGDGRRAPAGRGGRMDQMKAAGRVAAALSVVLFAQPLAAQSPAAPLARRARHARGARGALPRRRLPQVLLRPALPRSVDDTDPRAGARPRALRRRASPDPARRGASRRTRCASRARMDGSTSSARSTRILRRSCPRTCGARSPRASSRTRSAPGIRPRHWW